MIAATIAQLKESESNLKSQWMYYQDLLALNGFDGITDILVKFKQLQLENARMREALVEVLPYVVTQVVACNGLKCREPVCESCYFEAEKNAQIACDKYAKANEALATQPTEYNQLNDVLN